MIKTKKKLLVVVSLMLCLILNALPVFAAEKQSGECVDGSTLTDNTSAEYTEYSRAKGTYLASGTGSISNLGGRQVRISGSTNCHRVSDEVKVTLMLQRLEGGSWVYVNSLAPVSAYNTSRVSTSGTFSVAGGYYYRVYGAHTAKKGSVSETCTSYSDGIWVY